MVVTEVVVLVVTVVVVMMVDEGSLDGGEMVTVVVDNEAVDWG